MQDDFSPRALTSPNGVTRWQGFSGATYETAEEAMADAPPRAAPSSTTPDKPSLYERIAGGFMLALFTIFATMAVFIGISISIQESESNSWLIPASLILALIPAIAASIGWAILLDKVTNKRWNAEERVSSFAQGSFRLGGGLLMTAAFLAIAAVGVFLFAWLLGALFEGVSKGQTMIVLLLLGVMVVLVAKK
jgi:hypothetical protein